MDPLSLFTWDKTRKAIEELQLLLKCMICNEQPTDPLCMGSCDHFFCSSCIAKHPSNSCPICSIPSSPAQHNPDAIVSGLVACSSEILSLINGGKAIRNRQSLEAPPNVDKPYLPKKANNNIVKANVTCSSKKKGLKCPKPKNPNLSNRDRPKRKAVNNKESTSNSEQSSIQGIDSKAKEEKVTSNVFSTPNAKDAKAASSNRVITPPLTPAINKRNPKGETVLHSACLKGDLEKVEKLLFEGADPNTKDNAGWTPLHEACSSNFIKIAERLLECGALVDVPGNNNTTPLHDAVINGLPNVITLLRKWGANDKLRDIWGRNARSIADLCSSPGPLHTALDTPSDHSLKAAKMRRTLVHSKLVFTGSNLDGKSKRDLDNAAKLLKARVASEFSPDVTHVVVSCQPGSLNCQRTIKYMMGIVSGKFIVSSSWVNECLSSGGYVDPGDFIVAGSLANPLSGAPERARLNASLLKPGLFSGLHIYFKGTYANDLATKKDLELLVKYGGGVPLQRDPNPESIPEGERTVPFYAEEGSSLANCSHLCIYQEGSNEPQLKYDMAHVKTLPMAWILECIDFCRLVEPFK